ncbi:uncharacterized protein [Triticum aestivum]|uniref:uncharacterized protein isoform X2 n=1 Tax=Triticum aestivum TaxID=4565 RepID=UPI001D017288|nr:uncharacterized protein LOC123063666 isoform X2 [Triticum aestivum]
MGSHVKDSDSSYYLRPGCTHIGPSTKLKLKDFEEHGMTLLSRISLLSLLTRPRKKISLREEPVLLRTRSSKPTRSVTLICSLTLVLHTQKAMEVSKAPSSSGLATRHPPKEILETWHSANAVCFDVEALYAWMRVLSSLLISVGLGRRLPSGRQSNCHSFWGTVPFDEALAAWISLSKPSLSQVEDRLEKRPPRISQR